MNISFNANVKVERNFELEIFYKMMLEKRHYSVSELVDRDTDENALFICIKPGIVHDLQKDIKYFIKFGKLIGLYPPDNLLLSKLIRVIPALLLVVTLVDLVGMFCQPNSKTYSTASEICGKIGSPQFYTFGTFYYFYIQRNHDKLLRIYDAWKKLPAILEDKGLPLFTNVSFGIIMTSAILENICFHFKLFPVFEPPIGNKTSFEVFYDRSHHYWATIVPFTPYHVSILLLTNKFALYSWNYVDLLATIMSRALTFRGGILRS